jgi:translation initiation factor 3 subunit F
LSAICTFSFSLPIYLCICTNRHSNKHIQDILVVSYLANTIRTQMELSNRLATAQITLGGGEGANAGESGNNQRGGQRGGRGGGRGGREGQQQRNQERNAEEVRA